MPLKYEEKQSKFCNSNFIKARSKENISVSGVNMAKIRENSRNFLTLSLWRTVKRFCGFSRIFAIFSGHRNIFFRAIMSQNIYLFLIALQHIFRWKWHILPFTVCVYLFISFRKHSKRMDLYNVKYNTLQK